MSFAIGTRHIAACSDGKTRSALIVADADTFFSVPARVNVKGKTVTGFVFLAGLGEEKTLTFAANRWMKNADLLPVAVTAR